MVSEWTRALYGSVRAERLSPPVVSRLMGYASVALHEGLAEAQPSTRASLDGLMDSLTRARVALGIGREVQTGSAELGRAIGLAIVAWSRTDGYDSTRGRPYAVAVGPGLWVSDAPGNTYAAQNLSGATDFVALDNPANTLRPGVASDRGLIMNRPKRRGLTNLLPVNMAGVTEPYWGTIRPFILRSWDECPVADPPAYSVETGTPAGHWIAIASQMVGRRNLPARNAARLFVVTAVGQSDAFIATWGYKFRFNLIRPRTYIRRVIDSTWEPLISTPPFPEYPSGHSALSAAAAAGMTSLLGSQAFDDSTGVALGPTVRRFNSFAEAADQAGRTVGRCVGETIVRRLAASGAP
jgi:hypothetical protein